MIEFIFGKLLFLQTVTQAVRLGTYTNLHTQTLKEDFFVCIAFFMWQVICCLRCLTVPIEMSVHCNTLFAVEDVQGNAFNVATPRHFLKWKNKSTLINPNTQQGISQIFFPAAKIHPNCDPTRPGFEPGPATHEATNSPLHHQCLLCMAQYTSPSI